MPYNRPKYGNYYRPSFFGGFSFFPPVIKGLLISNLVVFVGIIFLHGYYIGNYSLSEFIFQAFALQPLDSGFGIWQLVTYMFMHAGFSHIFFNMLALWMFGMELENRWGSQKFLLYYLACGLGAGLANLLIAPLFTSTGPTVGASGAVYGILVAYGLKFPDRLIFIYFFVPLKAKYFVLLYMAIEVISIGSVDGIAHFAHLGGAVVGLVYLLIEGEDISLLSGLKMRLQNSGRSGGSSESWNGTYTDVSDAKIIDFREQANRSEQVNDQRRIDEILDKMNREGNQSLTEEEKRILSEASKRLFN